VWVERWASCIEALDISSVVLPLLDLARPFGFLGSQGLYVVQPLLSGLLDDLTIERATTLMNSPRLQGQLRMYLEGERD
jgi:hypothetical protein